MKNYMNQNSDPHLLWEHSTNAYRKHITIHLLESGERGHCICCEPITGFSDTEQLFCFDLFRQFVDCLARKKFGNYLKLVNNTGQLSATLPVLVCQTFEGAGCFLGVEAQKKRRDGWEADRHKDRQRESVSPVGQPGWWQPCKHWGAADKQEPPTYTPNLHPNPTVPTAAITGAALRTAVTRCSNVQILGDVTSNGAFMPTLYRTPYGLCCESFTGCSVEPHQLSHLMSGVSGAQNQTFSAL